MRRFLFDCGTRDPLASAGLLVLRASFGLMMLIGHGLMKVQNFDAMKGAWAKAAIWPLSEMSSPLSLMATIAAEVGCAGLLVLGLATRLAAFGLGFAMVVAAFQVHADAPFFMAGGPAKEPAILYLIPCVVLILSGAGGWSADRLLYQEKKKRFF